MMKSIVFSLIAMVAFSVTVPSISNAKGKNNGYSSSSYSYSPGTGSKSSSTYVNGYTRKDGTQVGGHYRSTPDNSFNNNWTTKPNINPYTGKEGTLETPRNNKSSW